MKTILLVALCGLLAAMVGGACGYMLAKHGPVFTYFLCAVIGGAFITYWSISDEHSHVSRPDRG